MNVIQILPKLNAGELTRIRVKFLYRGKSESGDQLWLRKFPSNTPLWGNCVYILDKNCTDYDWLVVYDDLPPEDSERFSKRSEPLACNPKNTLLITSEPSTIKVYGSKYVRQFGHVLTTQEPWAIKHPNAIYSQCGYRWFYGIGKEQIKEWDEIKKNKPNQKAAPISTVCSYKKQKNTVHAQRFEFTQRLKEAIPELEIFGRGVRALNDKADAIDAYKYHVVIENYSGKHHWSEKLADTYLGHALPFYYGCTNLERYFPEEAFILIDPYDVENSISIIREAVANDEYEKREAAVSAAREKILNDYNFFGVITKIIEEKHSTEATPQEPVSFLSRRACRNANPWNFVFYFYERYFVKIRHFFTKKDPQTV